MDVKLKCVKVDGSRVFMKKDNPSEIQAVSIFLCEPNMGRFKCYAKPELYDSIKATDGHIVNVEVDLDVKAKQDGTLSALVTSFKRI